MDKLILESTSGLSSNKANYVTRRTDSTSYARYVEGTAYNVPSNLDGFIFLSSSTLVNIKEIVDVFLEYETYKTDVLDGKTAKLIVVTKHTKVELEGNISYIKALFRSLCYATGN